MVIRQMAVPLAAIGGNSALTLIVIGVAVNVMQLAMLGVLGFGLVALFQVLNLPVEYNASSRASKQLEQLGFLAPGQKPIVRKMLSAAALTYVAAMLSAIAQFLYFLMIVSGRSNRS